MVRTRFREDGNTYSFVTRRTVYDPQQQQEQQQQRLQHQCVTSNLQPEVTNTAKQSIIANNTNGAQAGTGGEARSNADSVALPLRAKNSQLKEVVKENANKTKNTNNR